MDIRQIREKQGLSVREMAHKLGIGENYLYKIEAGLRPLSKSLRLQIELMDKNQPQTNVQLYSGDNCTNTGVSLQAPPPTTPTQEAPDDLAVVPAETLTEHIEVVQANNELLQEIRTDQEKELLLKREQGRQLSEVLEFVQGLDEMMQKRVREIIDERTRTIISATNHHIHTQAQVMITAIEGIINMVEAGVTTPDIFLRQLRAVRTQLEKMADFKQ